MTGDEDRSGSERRLTVPEAAAELGTTSEGVRARIKRGTLRTEREAGRVFVLLEGSPDADPPRQDADPPSDRTELVDELRGRVAFLESELERRGASEAELRRIIAALTSRLPQLEAPAEEREQPETPSEPVPDSRPPEPEPTSEHRPWWSRLFR